MLTTTMKGIAMLDDFFTRAILAGVGLAIAAGPLGCFVVWRRMAYFGDTMAHSALLGVVLSLIFEVNLMLAIFVVSTMVSLALLVLQRRGGLSADSILGILSHSALAVGLVLTGFLTWMRIDLMSYLFGDILAVGGLDLIIIWGGGTLVVAILLLLWKPLLASTVNHELAAAEGMRPDGARLVFMLLLAFVIAIAIKVVGILLITAMLIIPAAAARRLAGSPEAMAVWASVLGVVAIVAGLFGSLEFDTPSGPSIVVAALVLFLLAQIPSPFANRNLGGSQ